MVAWSQGRRVASEHTARTAPLLPCHKQSQFTQQECRQYAAPKLSADAGPPSPSYHLDLHVVLQVRRTRGRPAKLAVDLELQSPVLAASGQDITTSGAFSFENKIAENHGTICIGCPHRAATRLAPGPDAV